MKGLGINARRQFLRSTTLLGTGLLFGGCGDKGAGERRSDDQAPAEKAGSKAEVEVTAVEDLMREHGVLRRALFVYTEAAARLRGDPSAVPLETLQKTAALFRAFGEDYHEKKLEEAHIFPAVRKAGGEAAGYVEVLIAQHQRGREITDYILKTTQSGRPGAAGAGELARALDALVRMYRPHAAREDTGVFPAWKQVLTAAQLDEMGDKFEDIEREQFGEDGFENAVKQIAGIETSLGLADLGQFTVSSPPVR
jgi:hemerythrin-like domain-containing protein